MANARGSDSQPVEPELELEPYEAVVVNGNYINNSNYNPPPYEVEGEYIRGEPASAERIDSVPMALPVGAAYYEGADGADGYRQQSNVYGAGHASKRNHKEVNLDQGHEGQPEPEERIPRRVHRMGTVRENVDDEPQVAIHKPYFVGFVVVLCVIMFVVEMGFAKWKFEAFSANPMVGPGAPALVAAGAKQASLIRGGQWYRLIAPMFLHAGLVHMLMNLAVMAGLGKDLERTYGTPKVAIIFLLSGLFGVLMSCLFIPEVIGVGASGALFGLVGAMFGDFMHNYQFIHEGKAKYLCQLVLSAVVGLAVGLVPFIDNYAHCGGFACGTLASIVVFRPPEARVARQKAEAAAAGREDPENRGCRFLVVLSGAALFFGFLLAFVLLYSGVNAANCKNCKYISCVPSPWWTC